MDDETKHLQRNTAVCLRSRKGRLSANRRHVASEGGEQTNRSRRKDGQHTLKALHFLRRSCVTMPLSTRCLANSPPCRGSVLSTSATFAQNLWRKSQNSTDFAQNQWSFFLLLRNLEAKPAQRGAEVARWYVPSRELRLLAGHNRPFSLSFARQKARIAIFLAKFANPAAAQTQEQAASIRRTGNAPPTRGGATAQIHPLSMSQSQGFRQQTAQRQVQNASSVQVLLSSLIEMPLADFETRLQNELLDNEALEVSDHEENDGANYQNEEGEIFDAGDPLDDAVGDYRTLDDVPDNLREAYTNRGEDDRRERQIGAEETSYDDLYRQIGELDLTEHERAIMVYLVGSLDESGFLTKDDATLADELAFNEYIDTTPEEVARLAGLLQQFEPRGIGARNLRECLLLQLPRTGEAREVIDRFYDDFMHSRWNRIAERLQLTDEDIERIRREIGHLNPRPGSVLSEGSRATAPTVVPDFRVTIDTDGNPIVTQHRGDLPDLRVSPAFAETLVMHRAARERAAERGETAQFSRSQEEAFVYAHQKVTAAQAFIESVRRRHHTLQAVMETIVALQREFFVNDDDETLLVPMVLKDVAERAHVDISTVSRAINSKYVETDYGVYSLRHFFSTQFTSADGETVAARQVKAALAEIVENEDKRAPLSDEAIVEALAERGLKVARRTVSKYRSQLNIPKAGLRR